MPNQLDTITPASLAAVDTGTRTLVAGWLLGFRSPNTRAAYERDMRAWVRWIDDAGVGLLDVQRAHVDAYARCLEEVQGRRPSTVARALSVLSSFYGYAVDEDVISRNPAGRVKRPKVSDRSQTLGLDRDEARAVLAEAERAGTRDHLLVGLLMVNGLRASEVCAINVDDITTERGHRVVTVTGKGGTEDVVPLAPVLVDVLDQHVSERESGPLFVDAKGERVDRHDVTRVVARVTRRAGVDKRITPHSLRHTAVTMALDAGVPLRDVQDMARHADPRTTRRYDRARGSLDRHASYAVAGYLAE